MHQAKLNWRGPVTRDIDIHGVHAGHLVPSSRELGRKCRVMQILSDEEAPGTARRPWNQTRSERVRPWKRANLSSSQYVFLLRKVSETKSIMNM